MAERWYTTVTLGCQVTRLPQRAHFQGNFLTGEGLLRGASRLSIKLDECPDQPTPACKWKGWPLGDQELDWLGDF